MYGSGRRDVKRAAFKIVFLISGEYGWIDFKHELIVIIEFRIPKMNRINALN